MTHGWSCRHCEFKAWANGEKRLERKAESHLFEHHKGRVRKADFRLQWACPYCDASGTAHDKREIVGAFKRHLNEHVIEGIETDTRIVEEIDRNGNVLFDVPAESTAADNARLHFISGSDLAIVVTKSPKERLRLIHRRLSGWPERTIVVTTKRRPLDGTLDIDLADAPVELVELDRRLGPSELGETVSRIIDAHYTPGTRVSVGLDVLYDIVSAFDLRTSYEFIDMLSSRLRDVGAVAHIYMKSRPELSSVLNVLEGRIDLHIEADSQVFVSRPQD